MIRNYNHYIHPRQQFEGKIHIVCTVCGKHLRANYHYKSDDGIKYLHRLKTGHNEFAEIPRVPVQ